MTYYGWEINFYHPGYCCIIGRYHLCLNHWASLEKTEDFYLIVDEKNMMANCLGTFLKEILSYIAEQTMYGMSVFHHDYFLYIVRMGFFFWARCS